MHKRLSIFLIISTFFLFTAKAQDTSAYEIQRQKINALLAERSAKFGQYDESLNERTGIFGFQTKRDIKNSNEILRQIALNDNNIFQELKVLLDYKDLQVQEVKTTINNNSESIVNYRKTIKNLQDQNQELRNEFEKEEGASTTAHLFMSAFLIGCALLGYLLFRKNKQLKEYEKATF